MNKIAKYQEYKDSGVEWLGKIPIDWSTIRIKYIFKEINERSTNGNEDLLSVSQFTGVTKKSDKIEDGDLLTTASTLKGYKKVYKGDLVSNIMLAWNGSLGFSPFDGITSPAYSIYRLLGENDKGYFHYLLRTEIYKAEFKRNSSGVIDSRLRLYSDDFFRIQAILPPIEEQTAIADFLDRKTALIDKAIGIKQKQIELLNERRQILIHKAVSRGLNHDVKMKDSGVEWIGEIPEHWIIKRAKYLFDEIDERSLTGNEDLLSVSHMTGVTLRSEKNIFMFQPEDYSGSKLCREKDLVYNIMWAWMGALGVSGRVGIVSPSYAVYRQKHNYTFNSWFLEHLLRDINYVAHYNRVSTGLHSSRLRFYSNMFFNMKIGYPGIDEQDEIVEYLKSIMTKIDHAIFLKEQEIEKLKEYRATLINSAVTGKIKVS